MEGIIEAIIDEITYLTIQNALEQAVSADLEDIVPSMLLKEIYASAAINEEGLCTAAGCRICNEPFGEPHRHMELTPKSRIRRRKE